MYRRQRECLPIPCSWRASGEEASAEELEARVKNLLRLDRRWESGGPTSVKHTVIRYTSSDSPRLEGLRLLPGGRWLLTHMRDGVRVWDVDERPSGPAQYFPSPPLIPESTHARYSWDIDAIKVPGLYNIAISKAESR
jgi:hypothetical protein